MHILREREGGGGDWNRKPRLECVNSRHPPSITPGHAEVLGNYRADRLAGKATFTRGLRLGRSEVLRSLRQYLQAQCQGHHTVDCLEERAVGRGSARRSSLKGRERAIVSQTNIETFRGNIGEASERRLGTHMGFPEGIDTIVK